MDPKEVLGIAADASPEEIRTAYLRKVKEFPPDKAPEEFEKIRDAYDKLRDPRRRAQELLLSPDPLVPFPLLIPQDGPHRRFIGPHPWMEVLKGK